MTDRKRRGPSPPVEVIKRTVTPGPRPATTTPMAVPKGVATSVPPRRTFRPSRPPSTPPTEQQVLALAQREHVPYRIARGELLGKMKARIWRKLHAEEAKRFDQAYELVGKTPGLDLTDAFALLQSGMTLEALRARQARSQKKVQVKKARSEVAGDAIEHIFLGLIAQRAELSVVLGERGFLDILTRVEPIAFWFERTGRIEKLQVVVMAPRGTWEELSTGMERDPKLAQKPAAVPRQPEQRPINDPRPFLEHVGQPIELLLRNGVRLRQPLASVGPFDLVLGPSGKEMVVPLHAIVHWQKEHE